MMPNYPIEGFRPTRSRIQTNGHALPKEIEHAETRPPVRISGSHENQPWSENDQPQAEVEAQTVSRVVIPAAAQATFNIQPSPVTILAIRSRVAGIGSSRTVKIMSDMAR